MHRSSKSLALQKGMALAIILVALLFASLLLSVVAIPIRYDEQKLRERELVFAGTQIQMAIEAYAAPLDNGLVQLPEELSDLLFDTRSQIPRRHLRRIYIDPMTQSTDWGLIRNDRGITGVHSQSLKPTVQVAGFSQKNAELANAKNYSEWRFVARATPTP